MPYQPTDDEIRAAARVLAKAALLDPRVSANDHGTTLAWAEVLAPAQLATDNLLDAVTKHYATSTERLLPAEVLRLARAARRDHMDRTAVNGPERAQLEARADAKAGESSNVTTSPLPPATLEARRTALAKAAASIGQRHDVDTAATFDAAPPPARIDSPATIAAKVARARKGWTPPAWCDEEMSNDCLLAVGHIGPHHYGAAASRAAAEARQANA